MCIDVLNELPYLLNMPSQIKVSVSDQCAVARVFGRGAYGICSAFKEFGDSIAKEGGKDLIVDVRECSAVDSTFMGVLAGFCRKYSTENSGKLILLNASEEVQKSMTTLGLHHMLDVTGSEACDPASRLETLNTQASEGATARTMLKAHENLMDADESNQERFKDVVDYLRQDVAKRNDA